MKHKAARESSSIGSSRSAKSSISATLPSISQWLT
jgi:hypothetical protein